MKKKARIEVIDIAKAITIFLVIVGHSTGNFDTPLFRRVLYSFHMPLFFILAGMSIKPVKVSGFGGISSGRIYSRLLLPILSGD